MSGRRRSRPRQVRRLGAALACAVGAVAVLGAIFSGVVYEVTSGASVGLYATVALLFVGFALSGTAMLLTLQSLVSGRHRRLDNVVSIEDRV
ncbi:MAG: hypothetical protein KC492_09735, partial [Myxococcales bacterium]|nr:hypothetical protein [Myxococcales bacterium]